MNQLLAPNNKISIITNSDIRYEGTMYQMNSQDQTVALQNVVSFGTEGRRPENEIAPSSVQYEYIVFRGTDIKDIVFLNANTQNQSQSSGQPEQKSQQPAQQPFIQPDTKVDKQLPREKYNQKEKKEKEQELDIQQMNEMYQNLRLNIKDDDDKQQVEKYNKKGFFDEISTSVNKKERETREERYHQHQIDKDTFGSESVRENEMMSQMMRNQNYRGRNRGNYNRGGGGYYRNNNQQGGFYNNNRGNYQGNYQGGNRTQGNYQQYDHQRYRQSDYGNYDNRQKRGNYNNYNRGGRGKHNGGGEFQYYERKRVNSEENQNYRDGRGEERQTPQNENN